MHHVIAYKGKILARRSNAEQGMRRGSGPDYSEMSTIFKAMTFPGQQKAR